MFLHRNTDQASWWLDVLISHSNDSLNLPPRTPGKSTPLPSWQKIWSDFVSLFWLFTMFSSVKKRKYWAQRILESMWKYTEKPSFFSIYIWLVSFYEKKVRFYMWGSCHSLRWICLDYFMIHPWWRCNYTDVYLPIL